MAPRHGPARARRHAHVRLQEGEGEDQGEERTRHLWSDPLMTPVSKSPREQRALPRCFLGSRGREASMKHPRQLANTLLWAVRLDSQT